MAIHTRKEAIAHLDHKLIMATYGANDETHDSVTIECITCGEVLIAFEDLESEEEAHDPDL